MKIVEVLPQWVTRAAERWPEATAIAFRDERISYRELETTSNRIARALREGGCRRGDRVALLAPKEPATIAALLGIYKADAILVPLDDTSPAARLERVLRSCAPAWLLGRGSARRLGELAAAGALAAGTRIGWLGAEDELAASGVAAEFTARDVDRLPGTAVEQQNREEDPAHIFYTSGPTGEPEGVLVKHASVSRIVEWGVRHFAIAPGERVSGHSPLASDLSTFDLFGAFAAGAELHLVPPECNLLPQRLAEFIRRLRLAQWLSVPSVLTFMANADVVRQDDFPELRRVAWRGAPFPTPALAHWMRRLPHVRFTHLYGPTETTVASGYYDVLALPADPTAPLPIGHPCDGEELLVLGADLAPVPAGEVGELCIRGVGLSPGYWRDPVRTKAAFLDHPSGDPALRLYRTGELARVDGHGLVVLLGGADARGGEAAAATPGGASAA